jgi:hypothetical protein
MEGHENAKGEEAVVRSELNNEKPYMERRIVDYKIVSHSSSEKLAEIVRAAIREGWQPMGGPAINTNCGNSPLYQVLVKRAEPNGDTTV